MYLLLILIAKLLHPHVDIKNSGFCKMLVTNENAIRFVSCLSEPNICLKLKELAS